MIHSNDMKTHISTTPVVPHPGVFSVAELSPDDAGELIAVAIDERTADLHITQRAAADVIEEISGRTISSQFLRVGEQRSIEFELGDRLICAKLTASGKAKIKRDKSAFLAVSDYTFLIITRIG